MNESATGALTSSAVARTRREAKKEREGAVKYFENKETTRHREALKGLAQKAREVRNRRKDERAKAKQTCAVNVTSTKERTKDKAPQRRRAELAKTRTDCAFDVMNIEEHAAQDLETVTAERETEVSQRRSSRTATKHNRQRTKERASRTSARERRDELHDQVRHDLDPDLLPYFEEIKGAASFKKLCEGGRMTPTEAVMHMAHEDPEAVFAALERYTERELQREIEQHQRDLERFEHEGGRLGPEHDGHAETPVTEPAGGGRSSSSAESDGPKSGVKRRRTGGRKGARTSKTKASTGDAPAAKRSADGGREKGAKAPAVQIGLKVHPFGEGTISTGIERDGDEWVAHSFTGFRRFKRLGHAARWLEKRGFHADGTVFKPGEAPSGADAEAESGTDSAGDDTDDADGASGVDDEEAKPAEPSAARAPTSMVRTNAASGTNTATSTSEDHALWAWIRDYNLGPQIDHVRGEIPAEHVPYFNELLRDPNFRAAWPESRLSLLAAAQRLIAGHPGEVRAALDRAVRAGRFPEPVELGGPNARHELERALAGAERVYGSESREVEQLRAIASARFGAAAPHEVAPREAAPHKTTLHATQRHDNAPPAGHRLSPEERTGWIPGTEPAPAPAEQPAPPARRTLFEEEDTHPETPDGKRRHGDKDGTTPSAKAGKDPFVQQAFGTNFTNWLNQAGPQLTLDTAPVGRAERPDARETTGMHASAGAPGAAAQNAVASSAIHDAPRAVAREPETHMPHPSTHARREAANAPVPDEPDDEGPPRFGSQKFAEAMLYEDRGLSTLQVGFEHMPPRQFRVDLRQAGFRWMAGIERWQAPLDNARRERAREILRAYAATKGGSRNRRATPLLGGAALATATAAVQNGQPWPPNPSPDEAAEEEAEEGDEQQAGEDGGDRPDDDDSDDRGEEEGADGDGKLLNPYERKRASRVARLRARAGAVQSVADAVHDQARARAERIPFGQPILVGHYSEGRDRRFREKIHKGFGKAFELQGKAKELERRADAAEHNRAISSDDPDALEKLRAKIDQKQALIDRAKDINAVVRAARSRSKVGWEARAREQLSQMGIPESAIAGALEKDFAGRYGVPGYVLTNARGEIARLQHRIEELERRDKRPMKAPVQIGDATLSENRDENRVQIRFEGIPPKEVRSALRGAGFVWAPSVGAWQRKISDGAWWRAERVLKEHYPATTASPARTAGAASPEGATSDEPSSSPSAASVHVEAATAEGAAIETAPSPCDTHPGGLCLGSSVFAVSDLRDRDGNEIRTGREGTVVDVTCEHDGPCNYLVRWGSHTPSWHDATEISTDSSTPF